MQCADWSMSGQSRRPGRRARSVLLLLSLLLLHVPFILATNSPLSGQSLDQLVPEPPLYSSLQRPDSLDEDYDIRPFDIVDEKDQNLLNDDGRKDEDGYREKVDVKNEKDMKYFDNDEKYDDNFMSDKFDNEKKKERGFRNDRDDEFDDNFDEDDTEDDGDVSDDDDKDIDVGEVPEVANGLADDDFGDRKKRSSDQDWNKNKTSPPRVRTGDTILNIRGAVRDAIGDAGAAPGPRASSRLDAFVIRPAAAAERYEEPNDQAQDNEVINETPPNPNAVVVESGTRARLDCDLHNVTDVRWYRDGELVNLPLKNSEPIYRERIKKAAEQKTKDQGGRIPREFDLEAVIVTRATRGDAAKWRCTGMDVNGKILTAPPKQLMIYEPVRSVYLAVDGRRLDAGNTWVPARDRSALTVTCQAEGGVPSPSLTWRLTTSDPALDPRPYLKVKNTNHSVEGVSSSSVVVTAARELHNATLRCAARQGAGSGEFTAKLQVRVTYPPSFVISRWPGFGVSLSAGGAAALRCDVDSNPPARAWWQRDHDTATSPPPLEGSGEAANVASLRWATLSPSHAGWYRCRAAWMHNEYSSIGYYLNVLAPDASSPPPAPAAAADDAPDHQHVEVPLGGSVQLHCPKGSVGCWWRRVVGENSTALPAAAAAAPAWRPAGSRHAHGVLGIKEAIYEEGGEYRCVGARADDAARLKELKRVTVKVTGGATAVAVSSRSVSSGWRLECGVCGRGARAVWLRGAGRGAVVPAALVPDVAQHCWRTVLHVNEPDEVWCVATTSSGGAVAVFPPRSPRASPPRTPAPSRHIVTQNSAPRTSCAVANVLGVLAVAVWLFVL